METVIEILYFMMTHPCKMDISLAQKNFSKFWGHKYSSSWETLHNNRSVGAEFCRIVITPCPTTFLKAGTTGSKRTHWPSLLHSSTGFSNMSLHQGCELESNLLCHKAAKTVVARLAPFMAN